MVRLNASNPADAARGDLRESAGAFDRMFAAVGKVQERLERACGALERAGVPYAIIGGNAVAVWVATIDDGAVRNTRDVNLLLNESDFAAASAALQDVGFVQSQVMDVTVFLDGPDGKPSQGLHVLAAGEKVKASYASAAPKVDQAQVVDGKRVIGLEALVEMKLNSFRRKDQTHLMDLIAIGLIDGTWPDRFPPTLASRLQELIDDPDG